MGRDPHREYEEWCRRRLDAALLGTTQTVAIPAGNSRGAAAMTEPKTLRILSGLDAPLTRAYVERWWGVRQGSFVGSELAPEVLTFRREVIHGGARSFDDFLANVARLGRRARRKKPARHLSARHLGWD